MPFGGIRFLWRCKELFPYTNKSGTCIVETEKIHSITHAQMTSFDMVTPKTQMLKDLKIYTKNGLRCKEAKQIKVHRHKIQLWCIL